MNPNPSPEVTVETLLALRKENDAVQLITERLRVKEMGPADHIRTKHEVKAFVESGGDLTRAKSILESARQRLVLREQIAEKVTQRQGYTL